MTRAPNLRALSWLFVLAALLAPAALFLHHHIPARPDLRWSITSPFAPSGETMDTTRYHFGFELYFHNQGSWRVEEVRAHLPRHPADVADFLPDDAEWRLEGSTGNEDDPVVLVLGPLRPEDRAAIRLYGIVPADVTVVEADGVRIPETRIGRPRFHEEPWAPNWLILSGGLLILGLLFRVRALGTELQG